MSATETLDESRTQPGDDRRKSETPWHSGWCGPGPECRDGKQTNKAGEEIRWCRVVGVNGRDAATPYVVCACSCHDPEDVPDMSSVVAEWEKHQQMKAGAA